MNTRCKVQIRVLLLGLLALAQVGSAQTKTAPERTAATKIDPTPGGGKTPPQEGIKVHGHWSVTVRNPDGSLSSHHEFENSLDQEGKALILSFLTGSIFPLAALPPVWQLKVSGPICTQPQAGGCVIPVQPQLNLTTAEFDVSMSGTTKMAAAGQITAVATQITNIGSKGNALAQPITFSSRDLTQPDSATAQTPTPITVQAGQNVDFTVTFTVP
jgi:hypothetical protein